MKQKLGIIQLKSKVTIIGVIRIFKKPQYLAVALIASFLVANLIIWSLNIELARYIVGEPSLSIADKIEFFSSSIKDIFITYESNQALGIAVFSVLFGVNIAVFTYVLRNIGMKKIAGKSGKSGAGLIFAVVSGGCVACGTSLLAPLAATFGATSGAFLRDLSLWLNWIGSLLIIYSLYELGLIAAKAQSEKILTTKK